MAIEIVSQRDNRLLGRREVTFSIPSGSGLTTRKGAVAAVKENLSLKDEKLYLVSLSGHSGSRKLTGLLFVYEDEMLAKAQLPEHILTRNAPKVAKAEGKPEAKEKAEGKPEAKEKAEGKPEAKEKAKPSEGEGKPAAQEDS